jgi:hypothetical protein
MSFQRLRRFTPARAGIPLHQDYDNAVSAGETKALWISRERPRKDDTAALRRLRRCAIFARIAWSDFRLSAYLL